MPSTRPRVRLLPEQRRAAILDAARGIALEHGLENVTLRAVADRLDVASGLATYYFPSVEALLAEAFAGLVSEEYDAVFSPAPATDPLGRLAAVLRRTVDSTRDEVSLVWIDAWHLASRRPLLRAQVARQSERWVAGLAALIAAVPGTPDAETAARRIMAVVDGLMVQLVQRATIDGATVEELVFLVAETELGLPRGSLAS